MQKNSCVLGMEWEDTAQQFELEAGDQSAASRPVDQSKAEVYGGLTKQSPTEVPSSSPLVHSKLLG